MSSNGWRIVLKVRLKNMFFTARKVHFIGIGGSGMCGIAEVLLNLRYQVTGSDLRLSAVTERLELQYRQMLQTRDANALERDRMCDDCVVRNDEGRLALGIDVEFEAALDQLMLMEATVRRDLLKVS